MKLYITKLTDLWSFRIICWENIVNLQDFYWLNLKKILLNVLGVIRL